MDAERGIVRWRIEKGVLVARRGRRRDGYLEIDLRRRPCDAPGKARMHVEVEIANFYPAIASRFGQWLYAVTQSRIHVLVTYGFLRSLAKLDLAESRVGRFAARTRCPTRAARRPRATGLDPRPGGAVVRPAVSTTPQFATETDRGGRFVRRQSAFRGQVRERPEPGRCHVYVSLARPWASRIVIARRLLGLEDVLGMTVLDPIRDERGWRFTAEERDPSTTSGTWPRRTARPTAPSAAA